MTRFRRLPDDSPSLRRHLTRAAAGSLLLNVASKGLGLAASIILARALGAGGYGIYVSAIATLTLLSVPAVLGLPTLLVRQLAAYEVRREWNLMRGLIQGSNLVVIVVAVVIAGLGSAVIWALGDHLAPGSAHALWWAMALLPFTALAALCSAALRGFHHVLLGQLPQSLITPGLFLLFVAVWVAWRASPMLTPGVALAARLAAVVIALATGSWMLFRRLPGPVLEVVPSYDISGWARSAGPLLFLGGMTILNTQTDVLMLAAIKGPESAGVYRAASRAAELVAFSLVVVNIAIQPTISRLYAAGDLRRLQRMVTVAARGTLALALPVALTFSVFARQILTLLFGSSFALGATSLSILCAGQLVNAGAGSVGQILNMTGHERDSAMGLAIGAVTNVTLNAVLIPRWDMKGAAVATAVSLAVWNVALVVSVRRRTGLSSTALGYI